MWVLTRIRVFRDIKKLIEIILVIINKALYLRGDRYVATFQSIRRGFFTKACPYQTLVLSGSRIVK